MRGRAHWAEMLRWSSDTEVRHTAMLASGLGLAGPVLIAASLGHPGAGLAAAAGALIVGGSGQGAAGRGRGRDAAERLAAGLAAWGAGAVAAAQGWVMYPAVVLLAALAAVLGGYSRAMAMATTRFILGLIIAIKLMEAAPHRFGLAVMMMAGALWALLLGLLLEAAWPAWRTGRRAPPPAASEARPVTAAQRWARWTRSLRRLSGWRYPLRLSACLAAAEGVAWGWPGHHGQWAALTVVLLARRDLDTAPVRTSQRALGTVLGVVAASLFLAWHPPAWGLAAIIGLLGAVRPFLNARNYLLYSVVMTPLVLLMMEPGGAAGLGVLLDRVVATLVGSGLVLASLPLDKRLGRRDARAAEGGSGQGAPGDAAER